MKIKKIILVPILIIIFFGASCGAVFAYSLDNPVAKPMPSLINPLDFVNDAVSSNLPGFKSINFGGFISDGGQFGSLNLINTSGVSFDDLPGALKAVAVLAINLFLIVISTMAGILKALLPFLQ